MSDMEVPVFTNNGKKYSSSSVTPLNESNVLQFLNDYDNFVFDCDGVLWRTKHLIPGVDKTLSLLHKLGKNIFFITNNSTTSRDGYLKKIQEHGIKTQKEFIYGSSYGAATYLNSINFSKKAYVLGESGIVEELKAVGIDSIGLEHNKLYEISDLEKIQLDPSIGAVVSGLDRKLNYYKMTYAHLLLSNPDILFVVTNPDTSLPAANDVTYPGAGACSSGLLVSTGRKPIMLGKPETWLLDVLIKEHNVDRKKTIMIGDRLDTDILMGINGKIATLMVFTGISTFEEMQDDKNPIKPTYFIPSIGDLHHIYDRAPK